MSCEILSPTMDAKTDESSTPAVTASNSSEARLRLLQFLSPAMPVGAYSYSQGIEWAVGQNWIRDEADFEDWVSAQVKTTLAQQELPLLRRLYQSVSQEDVASTGAWAQYSVAVRESAEFRREEQDRAEAYYRVLQTISTIDAKWPKALFLKSPLVSMAWFSVAYGINEEDLLVSFAHNWLENTLITGVKIIPLGQSSAQRLLFNFAPNVMTAVQASADVSDDSIGVSLPALSMASCEHEVQYSRVYRS